MFGLGKVTCEICKARVAKRRARRGQDGRGSCVCNTCFTAWETAGKKCAECQTAVRGMQAPGIFAGGKGLGHSDCGGARLLRA